MRQTKEKEKNSVTLVTAVKIYLALRLKFYMYKWIDFISTEHSGVTLHIINVRILYTIALS